MRIKLLLIIRKLLRHYPPAICNLACCYEDGIGVDIDLKKALHLYQEAAQASSARGYYNLGRFYEYGIAGEPDYSQAMENYLKSHEMGYLDATVSIGYMYEAGRGVPQDYDKAVEFYTEAKNADFSRGYYALGNMYKVGLGVSKDTAQAIEYFRIAADKGHVSAMYNLAVLYDFEAEEQYRDMEKAIEYYQRAVARGHCGAMNNLGVCYKEGDGVKIDFDEAFKLFVDAAKGHDEHAYLNLARAYTYGQGTDIDLTAAKEWCQKAIDCEINDADELMKEIESKSQSKKGFSIFKRKKH